MKLIVSNMSTPIAIAVGLLITAPVHYRDYLFDKSIKEIYDAMEPIDHYVEELRRPAPGLEGNAYRHKVVNDRDLRITDLFTGVRVISNLLAINHQVGKQTFK